MKILERVEKIAKVLKAPNYFFTITSDKEIMIYLESEKGNRYSFRGYTINETVENAEEFIEENYKEKVDTSQKTLFEKNEDK